MKNNKQYTQEDVNQIVTVRQQDQHVIKDIENMEIPQIEVEEVKEPTEEELLQALLFAQDMFDRSSIPFVLLHQTAEAVHESLFPILTGGNINLGVMQRHMTQSGASMLKSLLNQYAKKCYIDENIVTFEYKSIPIQVDIIHNDYPFFKNPDTRFFRITEFKLPNPFDEYLIWKDQIK